MDTLKKSQISHKPVADKSQTSRRQVAGKSLQVQGKSRTSLGLALDLL